VLTVLDVLATAHSGRDAARALLEAERLLSEERRLSREWRDLWQAAWRRGVVALSDLKEAALYAAALQRHLLSAPDLLPRQAFLKFAIDAASPLLFPTPPDALVVLRAGLVRRVERCMQLLGVMPMPEWAAPQPRAQHGPAEDEGEGSEDDDGGAGGGGGGGGGGAGPTAAGRAAALLGAGGALVAPLVADAAAPRVKADWEALLARVRALRPVERYVVRAVVYRRHLADEADLDPGAPSAAAPRWPVAWLLLRPARHGPPHQLPTRDLVVPVAIDAALPDYLVRAELYAHRTRVAWLPGDRFRMFFGGKISSKTHKKVKTGGVWYKGEVAALAAAQPGAGAPLAEREAYDPWESVVVKWERRAAEEDTERVSPWEIEIDQEEEVRRDEEARRQIQAAARASRARASARRAVDDAEAAAQAAEWARQDAATAEATAAAARSGELLAMFASKPDAEEGMFNEAVYGTAAQAAAAAASAALAAPIAAAAAARAAPAASRQPYSFVAPPRSALPAPLAAPVPSSVPSGPLRKGQEVPAEVLEALRRLDAPQLTTLITNFYRGLKGKYKVPVFAHRELDLHGVWWAVVAHGGYEVVSSHKLWKEVCRSLAIDLSGQTSASYNMRLNYERCLLDFENYLACGQFQADVAAGRAPLHTHLTDPTVTRFTIPGAYSAPVGMVVAAPVPVPVPAPAPAPAGPSAKVVLKLTAKAAAAGEPAGAAHVSPCAVLPCLPRALRLRRASEEGDASGP
jgi:hypothetical protein